MAETLDKQVKNTNLGNSGEPHRWKPGESGNPNGRPKNVKYISEALRELLGGDPALLKELVLAIASKAGKGDVQAFKEITDRIEGKVVETHKFGGDIPVSIVYKLKESKDG